MTLSGQGGKQGKNSMEPIRIDGAKIRALRKARHWTQYQLALKSGVFQNNISNLENGIQLGATIRTMVALARTFGVPLDTLFVLPTNTNPVQPTDPQIDRIRQFAKKMTPAEQDLATTFMCFVLTQRKKVKSAKRQEYLEQATNRRHE